ncbi:helix-turn-helix domain-containing protein [Rhodanobacter glycinis]|uniref:helix-turn-helix domain-containing protein n=1 Tax=Rhodanobacter glycinis TaxID=582702 RepID=UPI0013759A4C|nr:helix-turn-helix transcriptional regulator [Rhodanobacter glycinis]
MAALIKSRLDAIPGMTQDSLGEQLGVSQGMVSHWVDGRSAVTAKRARALANALGIDDPALISVDYREIVGPVSASVGTSEESLALRLDTSTILKIVETFEVVQEMYKDEGRVYDIEAEPERFYEAMTTYDQLPEGQTLSEFVKLSKQVHWISPQGATSYGRGKEVPAKGTIGRKVGK